MWATVESRGSVMVVQKNEEGRVLREDESGGK